jgi:simple sugar transport system permease protein
MSETAEQHAEVAGQPPGKPPASGTGPGNLLRRAGTVFIRQREATILVVTVALLIYFSLASSTFLTAGNISNLLSGYAAPIIIIAIGEVLLLICGEIDLSVGFVLTFSPFLMHYLIDYYSVPVIPAILISLLFGVIVGWVNGFLTVTVGLPSFITTLGTGFILYGLVLTTSNAYPANIPTKAASYAKIFGTQSGFGQWSPIIWGAVLVIIFHIVLTRTRYGLHTIATGGNLLGAREAGINVARVKYTAFMITGFMGALAGLQTAFYDNTIDPSAGQYTPMFFAVTAAVIGGTAMLGGTGTIIGAFLGAIVLATLQDGLSILGISANPLDIIFGAAIIIAMIANVRLARLRAAGRD